MRRMIRNRGEIQAARNMRETFVDRPPSKRQKMPWDWPQSMLYVGGCESIMYVSDKWKRQRGDTEDYKHVAEATQYVLVPPNFLRDYHSSKPFDVPSEEFLMPKQMPTAFAELAEIYGIQIEFLDGNIHEVQIARAKLGGAKNRDFGTFLFVYNNEGVHVVICGEQLAVEKDGITG